MDETVQGQNSPAFPTTTTGNGVEQPLPEEEESSTESLIAADEPPSTHRSPGPQTPEGKEISKHNAIRHGIFSEVTVLPGESRNEYNSLLKGLSEALQPENRLEKVLVEKLAVLAWRHRRLLQAEGAEIQQDSEFVEWDQRMRQTREAEMAKRTLIREFKTFGDRPGLIPEIQNPDILQYCIELLLELQTRIKSRGFDNEHDQSTLQIIYGGSSNLHGTLLNRYWLWHNTFNTPEEERQRKGGLTREQCKEKLFSEIDAEIQRLRDFGEKWTNTQSERIKLEVLRRKIPDSAKVDRLLKYEASLERSFDRTLNQLERLQRQRRGQPLGPRVDVHVSAES